MYAPVLVIGKPKSNQTEKFNRWGSAHKKGYQNGPLGAPFWKMAPCFTDGQTVPQGSRFGATYFFECNVAFTNPNGRTADRCYQMYYLPCFAVNNERYLNFSSYKQIFRENRFHKHLTDSVLLLTYLHMRTVRFPLCGCEEMAKCHGKP